MESRLLKLLSLERTPAELVAKTGASRSTVHRALNVLIGQKQVIKTRKGPHATYLAAPADLVLEKQLAAQQAASVAIELPARWAQVLQSFLELYSRLTLGQWLEPAQSARFGELYEDLPPQQIQALESLLGELKARAIGFPPNGSWGIHGPGAHPLGPKAWAISRAIRYRMAWDREPTGGMGVSFDEPLASESTNEVQVISSDQGASEYRLTLQLSFGMAQAVKVALDCIVEIARGRFEVLLDKERMCPSPREKSMTPDLDRVTDTLQVLAEVIKVAPGTRAEIKATELQALMTAALLLADEAVSSATTKNVRPKLQKDGNFKAVDPAAGLSHPMGWRVFLNAEPQAVTLENLPQGMAISPGKRGYLILQLDERTETWVEVGNSHSMQTAILMARNIANKRPARTFGMGSSTL